MIIKEPFFFSDCVETEVEKRGGEGRESGVKRKEKDRSLIHFTPFSILSVRSNKCQRYKHLSDERFYRSIAVLVTSDTKTPINVCTHLVTF